MSEKYIFKNMVLERKGPYILQLITNRKLTHTYHSHDFYEIVVVFEGECVHMVNQKKFTQSTNEVVLLRPDDKHTFCGQSSTVKVLSLSVSIDEFITVAGAIDPEFVNYIGEEDHRRFVLSEDQTNEIVGKSVNGVTNENVFWEYKIILFLLLAYSYESKKDYKNDLPNNLIFALKEMRKEENFKKGVTALLELTGYSYSHLSRLMKKYLHTTPHEYLIDLRLNIAYKHIVYTDELLEHISEYVGYESYTHFVAIFKKKYDVTPAKLRRNMGVHTV